MTITNNTNDIIDINSEVTRPSLDRRVNLKEYYKHVKNCISCKEDYGVDFDSLENGFCPICSRKLWDKRVKKKDIPKDDEEIIKDIYKDIRRLN